MCGHVALVMRVHMSGHVALVMRVHVWTCCVSYEGTRLDMLLYPRGVSSKPSLQATTTLHLQ